MRFIWLLLLLFVSTVNSANFDCSSILLTDRERQLFLDGHNDARRSMAKGFEPNKCGNLTSGKNVYELTWNCEMEEKAQEWASTCPSEFQTFDSSWGQNYMTYTSISDRLQTIASSINGWWGPARTVGLDDPDNKYTTSGLYTFSNMAHGKTTEIGCAINTCLLKTVVTCIYNKRGYITNGVIYEKGNSCASDSDCTTYTDSTCNDGLCHTEPQDPIVETYDMCPDVTDMSDQARMAFLNTHNKLRSNLAKGGIEKDGIAVGAFAPQAKQMIKMRYSCDVEAYARSWGLGCSFKHSEPSDRPGLGENLYYTTALNFNKILTGESASYAWWSELEEFGVGEENILTNAVFNRGVGHYTQMAWEKSTDLGCYVAHCSNMTLTVCQYGPAGNMLDQIIYTKGSSCTQDSDCPASQTCSVADGLCVLP